MTDRITSLEGWTFGFIGPARTGRSQHPPPSQPALPLDESPKREIDTVADLDFERSRRRFAEGA